MSVPPRPIMLALGRATALIAAGLAPALIAPSSAVAAPVRTVRITVATDGTQADGDSLITAVSANGRYVAFDSGATNLVPDDTNGFGDVFLRDRRAGTTTRISVSSTGVQGDSISGSPSISANGRYVAFVSASATLVPGDTNDSWDIFVHDTRTRSTERVSVSSGGAQTDGDGLHPSISADGRYVAFTSYAGTLVPGARYGHIFRHDRVTGETLLVSQNTDGRPADAHSAFPVISADGQHVTFTSAGTDVVPGDTNGVRDVFVRDLTTGRTVRVSVGADGTESSYDSFSDSVSGDGRVVLFTTVGPLVAGDTNGRDDVYVHDVRTGTTRAVSESVPGGHGDGYSGGGVVTPDGRYAAFHSEAPDLAPGDDNGMVDIFRRDLESGEVVLVSRTKQDVPGNGYSINPQITPDGRFVTYDSTATDLVRGDTNDHTDVFLADLAR